MESRQKTTQQLPKDTNKIKRDKEKMSLDPLWKVPKNMNRIIHQLQDDKNPEYSEIAFERKINNHEVSEMVTSPADIHDHFILPYTYSTSRLNPENNFPSRLREEMRSISPCPPSPIQSNKRKLSQEDRIPEPLYYRPLKRVFKNPSTRNATLGIYTSHKRSNSTESTTSDISMCTPAGSIPSPHSDPSPHRLFPGAISLNLSGTGTDFSNMKLS